MSSHRVIRKSRMAGGQSVRRILQASRPGAALRSPTAVHPVKVEDAGGGMACLIVSEMLPRSVADRIAHILREEGQPATKALPRI